MQSYLLELLHNLFASGVLKMLFLQKEVHQKKQKIRRHQLVKRQPFLNIMKMNETDDRVKVLIHSFCMHIFALSGIT